MTGNRAVAEAVSVPLQKEETTIGRGHGNDVVLDEIHVSKHHAVIHSRPGGYSVADAGSRHGTLVNGFRISGERPLRAGDRIGVGQIVLQFHEEGPGIAFLTQEPNLIADTGNAPVPETFALGTKVDATVALAVPAEQTLPLEKQSGNRLHELQRVAEALQATDDLEQLLQTLLEILWGIFHPDRGIIFLKQPGEEELSVHAVRPVGPVRYSETILNRAVNARETVLAADTQHDEGLSGAVSIAELSIQAAICCPLLLHGKLLGAIYLDTRANVFDYQDDDLLLLNIIAANAAVAVENAMLMSSRFGTQRLSASEIGPMVYESKPMQAAVTKMNALAEADSPVLVTGPAGCGKIYIARVLHIKGRQPNEPFITVDCSNYTDEAAREVLFGAAGGPESKPKASAISLAGGGTLVLKHFGALGAISQKALLDWMFRVHSAKDGPLPRIVATTSIDLAKLTEGGKFNAELADLFVSSTIEVPPLQKRKEDILPLARAFLAAKNQKAKSYEQVLGKSAEAALEALRYRDRNVAELKDVVEFASMLAEGAEIGSEHIFAGPQGRSGRLEFDLTQLAPVRWLTGAAAVMMVRVAAGAFFLALFLACLLLPATNTGKIANSLVWGLWWPGLMVLFLTVGRIWCLACPVSNSGKLARMVRGFNLKPPAWLKTNTGWVTAGLFFLIVWTEGIFHMPESPMATAFLLLALVLCACVFAVLYERETWCRYVCPLGSLAASFSVSSAVQVHSNPSICTTTCKTHNCFKGSETQEGCPMFHHPLYMRDSQYCKFCFACVRNCPHGSARVYLRPLLQDLWRVADLTPSLIPFAMSTVLLPLVLLITNRGWLGSETFIGFTALSLGALVLGAGMALALAKTLSPDADPVLAARVSFAAMLLAWGPYMAYHLEFVPGLSSMVIVSSGSAGPGLQVIVLLQIATLLLAGLLCGTALWRIAARFKIEGGHHRPGVWRAVAVCCLLYFAVSMLLLIHTGVHG
ncbi:sigma 54-interacting transcriptional regulator [Candidatus Poribacteria bacterium]|nr:sigma 54-interacting transcriptional regulator [Candidatus Poribacteria bacterium]